MTRHQPVPAQAEPLGEKLTIVARQVFDGLAMRGPAAVVIRGDKVDVITDTAMTEGPCLILPEDMVLAPGFIDLQVNGGGGVLLNDWPDVAGIAAIVAAHRRFGTTGLLPTLITGAPEVLAALAEAMPAAHALAGVLGFHLEGPFINPLRKGIHPAQHIRPLAEADMRLLQAFAGHGRTLVTLAPECVPAAAVRTLVDAGITVSIGHSEATGAQVAAAVQAGASIATHLFNAMSQMTPREAGVVGAVLGGGALSAGIICDGLHVDPLNIRTAHRCLGPQRLFLVSDAMPSVGADGSGFMLHGRKITLDNGRLSDEAGTLAGAHLTMLDAVRRAVVLVGLPLADALAMATSTPAAVIGLEDTVGHIAPGRIADLVAFAPSGDPIVWCAGVRQD